MEKASTVIEPQQFAFIVPGIVPENGTYLTLQQMKTVVRRHLQEKKINIEEDDYDEQNNGVFKKFNYVFIIDDYDNVISESWFIEKYIVQQHRLEAKYGPYAMGIQRELSDVELTDKHFFENLQLHCDGDIKRNMTRNDEKESLIERIKNGFGFDISIFPGEYKREKYKLLYLLYDFERRFKVELVTFLSNATMENQERAIFRLDSTHNGKLMNFLKKSLEKELESDVISEMNDILTSMTTEWEEMINRLMYKVNVYYENNTHGDLALANGELDFIHVKEDDLVEEEKKGYYKQSLLESFYFKLLEYENIGVESDLIGITEWEMQSDHNDIDSCSLNGFYGVEINKSQAFHFLEENMELLLPFIYRIDDFGRKEKNKYRRLIDDVDKYIEILEANTAAVNEETIPALMVIACIYEVAYIGKEKLENDFYRHKDTPTLKAQFKWGEHAFRKNQFAWLSRVSYRYHMFCNREGAAYTAIHAARTIEKLMMKTMFCNNIYDMQFIHNYYMKILHQYLVPESDVEKYICKFDDLVKQEYPEYKVVNRWELNTRYFFATFGDTDLWHGLAESACKLIMNGERYMSEQRIELDLEKRDNSFGGCDHYSLVMEVWPERKYLLFWNFRECYTQAELQIFFDNGYYKHLHH